MTDLLPSALRAARRVAPAARLWHRYGERMFQNAMADNEAQIGSALAAIGLPAGARVLDLGCWDASTASRYVPSAAHLYGVEGSRNAAAQATDRGVRVVVADLDFTLPFADDCFDAVASNQVLEHLGDTDTFVSECRRVLRPGGYVAVSTENLASWHNIGALVLGWQAFSLSNVCELRAGIGNPLANRRGGHDSEVPALQHRRVFSYRGLLELFDAHGFTDLAVRGAGYYPFPTCVGRADPRHAAFLTIVGRRPLSDGASVAP